MNLPRIAAWIWLPAFAAAAPAAEYFTIRVVDEQTGRGVPLVELRTVNDVCFYTDSNGIVAFAEPGLMERDVFFHVRSHGYQFPADGFGYRGKRLRTTPGGSATLALKRLNLAERLYRVTGGGIYRDSLLVGQPVPLRKPVLDGLVLGSDSVQSAVYHGKLYWFWGDTNRPGYPLGNFHVPGAVSELPGSGGLAPERGVDLHYFVDPSGFARPTCRMPGEGPTWIGGLAVVKDRQGEERMFAGYVKIKPPLTVYRRGLACWNDQSEQFEPIADFPEDAPGFPEGHPLLHTADGTEYVYFCNPYPLVRVLASAEAIVRPEAYETFTCLKPGSKPSQPEIDRSDGGPARYAWRRGAPAVGPAEQRELVGRGELRADEAWLRLCDRQSGAPVLAHRGSVCFNRFRRRFVMVATESMGTSALGEMWYAEADAPEGPWAYAVKIVTHDRYSFYNPKQHPAFDQQGGRVIYFEGTYTATFSGNPTPTPRYDYNQIMYRLDLSDVRTALPVAFYALPDGPPCRFRTGEAQQDFVDWRQIAFFAPDRPAVGAVPVYAGATDEGHPCLELGGPEKGAATAVFYAVPPDADTAPEAVVGLWEFRDAAGRRAYSTDPGWDRAGYSRQPAPLCRVWPAPVPPGHADRGCRQSPMGNAGWRDWQRSGLRGLGFFVAGRLVVRSGLDLCGPQAFGRDLAVLADVLEADGDLLRDARLLHRHSVDRVGAGHRLLRVGDDDELRPGEEPLQHLDEAVDVGLVQGGVHLVEHAERAGPAAEYGQQQRYAGERLLAAA
jgi:hypothetical protein